MTLFPFGLIVQGETVLSCCPSIHSTVPRSVRKLIISGLLTFSFYLFVFWLCNSFGTLTCEQQGRGSVPSRTFAGRNYPGAKTQTHFYFNPVIWKWHNDYNFKTQRLHSAAIYCHFENTVIHIIKNKKIPTTTLLSVGHPHTRWALLPEADVEELKPSLCPFG